MFEQLLDRAIVEAVNRLLDHAADTVRAELEGQGHRLTGSLIESLRVEVKVRREAILGLVWLNEYFPYLDRPLSPDRVPYQRGSGRKTSKVVTALQGYWERRGLSRKEATRATFATLNKWKAEGRPTKASFKYARNGRRTGFLEYSIQQIEASADRVLGVEVENEVGKALTTAIRAAT
jgi:hypothetical protein